MDIGKAGAVAGAELGWVVDGGECVLGKLVVVVPSQILPVGDDDVISFSLLRSRFLNLALRFWNQTYLKMIKGGDVH